MARVSVELFSFLAELADGNRQVIVEGETIGEVLHELSIRYPALGQKLLDSLLGVNPGLAVYLNGRELAFPTSMGRALANGDHLTVLPIVAGGWAAMGV